MKLPKLAKAAGPGAVRGRAAGSGSGGTGAPGWEPHAHVRLVRRSRWRVAALGTLVVTTVLAVLSAAAYGVAARTLYGEVQERLVRVAERLTEQGIGSGAFLVVDQRDRPLLAPLPPYASHLAGAGMHLIKDPEFGTLAVMRPPQGPNAPALVATPAQGQEQALSEFLRLLIALTLAGGLAALPAGYVLAGRALRPLDEAVRERSEFVALASHQLRTPLSVIRTSAELARDSRGLEAGEALHTILGQAERMEVLARRLTDLARAETDHRGDRLGTDLAQAARQAMAALGPAAEQAGVGLDLQADGPVWARAAPDEVADLLVALIENAIRYSPRGGQVGVRAWEVGRRACIDIADQGPGIPADVLPRITQPFYQAPGDRRQSGSHGLGLAIARAIAERRGGRLEIRSAPGEGTTVLARFPVPRSVPQPQA